jgi:hypothetical protein
MVRFYVTDNEQKYFYNLKSSDSYIISISGRVFLRHALVFMVGRCKGATAIASGVSFWPCQIVILY